ncbi:hypothetical protein RUM43_010727 [Polyplax serrata]|uniref:Endonuclease n=1 Tax=Polyplax serrata TaxID=468196 RepID=A0AAN8P0S7_POLSC
MSALWRFSILSGTAITAYLAGRYQSQYETSFESNDGPGVPVFPKIYAATPLIEDSKISVVSTQNIKDSDLAGQRDKNESIPVAVRVSQVMKFGFPSLDNVRSFEDFVLSYDKRNRVANWVFEHLTKDTVKYNDKVDRSKCDFFEDESIHPYFRSKNSDYKGSGFDRGHLAAAGNHKWNQKQCEQTFVLSNMAPQVGHGFNRDYWNKLEKHVRKLTKKYPNVYVCTGPLYLPKKEADGKTYVKYQVIGANTVAVPTHFYKIAVMEAPDATYEMEAYVMPNAVISDDTPLTNFQVYY